jgi:nickel-dependent lactate racemase
MRVVATFVVLMAFVANAQVARAEATPVGVDRAHAAVVAKADGILNIAYPTAQGNTAVPAGNWQRWGAGYALSERFSYRDSDGVAQSFTLRFMLNANGQVTSVNVTQQSEFWPPFATGNLLIAAFKAAAEKDIADARAIGREAPALAVAVSRAGSIEDVVIAAINFSR